MPQAMLVCSVPGRLCVWSSPACNRVPLTHPPTHPNPPTHARGPFSEFTLRTVEFSSRRALCSVVAGLKPQFPIQRFWGLCARSDRVNPPWYGPFLPPSLAPRLVKLDPPYRPICPLSVRVYVDATLLGMGEVQVDLSFGTSPGATRTGRASCVVWCSLTARSTARPFSIPHRGLGTLPRCTL